MSVVEPLKGEVRIAKGGMASAASVELGVGNASPDGDYDVAGVARRRNGRGRDRISALPDDGPSHGADRVSLRLCGDGKRDHQKDWGKGHDKA